MRYFILYVPFLGAALVSFDPVVSYWVAWLGSFWIFFWVFFSGIFPLPKDGRGNLLFLRPVVLTHLILVGYMAISSIFFFIDANGYYYFEFDRNRQATFEQMDLIAACQRYYCLAHACFVAGLMMIRPRPLQPRWRMRVPVNSALLLILTGIWMVLSLAFKVLPGMNQFHAMLERLSLVTSVLALAVALAEGNRRTTLIAAALFGVNLANALLSGWKEEVIVPVLILCVFVYPYYKKTVMLIGPVVLIFLFTILPTVAGIIRSQAWFEGGDSQAAAKEALRVLQSDDNGLAGTNWAFLTERISEIGMFVRYVEYVPAGRDYYYLEILSQGLVNVVPRIFYPGKPITESVVMARVYEAGVVESNSSVSAKPPLVTDGYLSGGVLGVFITFLLLGMFAEWVSGKAEFLFGSYQLGTCVMFTGLFQTIWRPNCFEFLFNSLLWSLIFMYVLHWVGRKTGWIVRDQGKPAPVNVSHKSLPQSVGATR